MYIFAHISVFLFFFFHKKNIYFALYNCHIYLLYLFMLISMYNKSEEKYIFCPLEPICW
jgi:hypothetical protein